MIDCLLIGYNEINFEDEVRRMTSMGADSISYKDFSLGIIKYQDKHYRALDILTKFYNKNTSSKHINFHNADVLWQGIMYLGTYLTKNGYSFDYINLVHLEKEQLKHKLTNQNILTIAITTTIYISIDPILEIVKFIKKYNRNVKIIIGGPFISKLFEEINLEQIQEVLKLMNADFYINSLEGENTLIKLLSEIKGKNDYKNINNIAYKENDEYLFTSLLKENNLLEDNRIDYSLFSKKELRKTINLRTSKSCPFSCSYCGFPLRSEKYSFLDVETIEEELKVLKKVSSIKYINFIDDTFNVPKNRFKEILKMMIKNKFDFNWYSFYRCDFGDEEIIELMQKAGCIGVFLGIESANNNILKIMNKTARVQDYVKSIPLLKQANITVFASTIIGFPGETYSTIQETNDFLKEIKPDFFRPQIWWSDPLTPILKEKDKYNIRGLGFNWSHNTMDSKIAYDLFEKTFLSIENSVWVPDPGFNAYGMYYLMEKGMSIKQIKNFLNSFNNVVKEKILFPKNKNISEKLLENLVQSCQFNQNDNNNNININSGYESAEKFWLKFCKNQPMLTSKNKKSEKKNSTIYTLKKCELLKIKRVDFTNIIIGVYLILLSKINNIDSVSVILAANSEMPIAIKASINDNLVFESLITSITKNILEANLYSLYCLYILTNNLRLKEHGLCCPQIRYGYFSTNTNKSINSKEVLSSYPNIDQNLELILKIVEVDDDININFEYNENIFTDGEINHLTNYLIYILKEITMDKYIYDITLNREENKNDLLIQLQEQSFSFN